MSFLYPENGMAQNYLGLCTTEPGATAPESSHITFQPSIRPSCSAWYSNMTEIT